MREHIQRGEDERFDLTKNWSEKAFRIGKINGIRCFEARHKKTKKKQELEWNLRTYRSVSGTISGNTYYTRVKYSSIFYNIFIYFAGRIRVHAGDRMEISDFERNIFSAAVFFLFFFYVCKLYEGNRELSPSDPRIFLVRFCKIPPRNHLHIRSSLDIGFVALKAPKNL